MATLLSPIDLYSELRATKDLLIRNDCQGAMAKLLAIERNNLCPEWYDKAQLVQIKDLLDLAIIYAIIKLDVPAIETIYGIKDIIEPIVQRQLLLPNRFESGGDIGDLAVLPDLALKMIRENIMIF